jgi:heme oxygenase
LDESIEEEASPFIKKLLYIKELVTTKELYKWAKEANYLLSDINSIITSYRENLKKAILYKINYKDTKGLLENTKL